MNINFYPSTYCHLNIELYEPEGGYYWHAVIGSVFEENILQARKLNGEWAITARKSGEWFVIAQSKNWRDRTGKQP